MSSNNILITGAISLSNKGTLAILLATVEGIKKINPYSKISVELFFPKKQKTIFNLEKKEIKVVPPFLLNPFRNIKTILNTNLIVDISAEAFVQYYTEGIFQEFKRYLIHTIPLLFAIFFKKKYILFAQTLGPFGKYKLLMKLILSKANSVSVRDSTSIKNLQKEGFDTSKIESISDPAFTLKTANKNELKTVFKKEHLDQLFKRDKTQSLIIGICLARVTGRVLSEKEYTQIINKFAIVCDNLIEKYDCCIIFIPHSSGKINPQNNDFLVGKDLSKKMKFKNKFFIIKGDYGPAIFKGIIAKCDFLISYRMHPAIFALSCGVPTILVAFNDKAYGVMKKFGVEKYVCDTRTLESKEILQLFAQLHREKKQIKNQLLKNIGPVQESVWKAFEKMGKLMCFKKNKFLLKK